MRFQVFQDFRTPLSSNEPSLKLSVLRPGGPPADMTLCVHSPTLTCRATCLCSRTSTMSQTYVRCAVPLDAIHCLIGAVVHERRLCVQLPVLLAWDAGELARLGVASQACSTVLLTFLVCLLAPLACHQVVRLYGAKLRKHDIPN